MDVRMPKLDGLQATRLVLARTVLPGADSDHLRLRRVRLRGAAVGGQRLPAQGRARRAAARRGPRASRPATR